MRSDMCDIRKSSPQLKNESYLLRTRVPQAWALSTSIFGDRPGGYKMMFMVWAPVVQSVIHTLKLLFHPAGASERDPG